MVKGEWERCGRGGDGREAGEVERGDEEIREDWKRDECGRQGGKVELKKIMMDL